MKVLTSQNLNGVAVYTQYYNYIKYGTYHERFLIDMSRVSGDIHSTHTVEFICRQIFDNPKHLWLMIKQSLRNFDKARKEKGYVFYTLVINRSLLTQYQVKILDRYFNRCSHREPEGQYVHPRQQWNLYIVDLQN
jgi:hypothetical protein